MKIQKIISILTLISLSSTQCMELGKSKNNTNTNPLTLQVNKYLIETLKRDIKHNTSNPILFYERSQRLHLLEKLLDKKIDITFNNQDENIRYWVGKDKIISSNILYEKLLSLLSYKIHTQQNVVIAHAPYDRKTPIAVSLQINNSLLNFTATHPLDYNTKNILKKFLCKYAQETVVQKINNPQTYPQQFMVDQNYALYPSNINVQYEYVELSDDDYDLFMSLPYPTQELLVAILLEK